MQKQMLPVPAKDVFNKDKYQNPFLRENGSIKPPIKMMQYEDDESEDSYTSPKDPLNRSEGEIGGDLHMWQMTQKSRPEPGKRVPVRESEDDTTKVVGAKKGVMHSIESFG